MTERPILLRYHEVALKGGNRDWFERRLASNARTLVIRENGGEAKAGIERIYGRVILNAAWTPATRSALSHTFGLKSFSPMIRVPTSLEEITRAAVEQFALLVEERGLPARFRIEARRSDKVLPQRSMEIERIVGGAVLARFPSLKVSLEEPDAVVGIEVRSGQSCIWTEKVPGIGGLPVGTNAPLMTLISGGLDSPVAAIKVMKRGSSTEFVHFHGAPFVGDDALAKVEDLVRIVNRYSPHRQALHVIRFGKIQERIALASDARIRTVLYRRLMMRVATEVARRRGAHALVTGESLGQVASQTVENLSTIDAAAGIPVIRPLVTYDKEEIIADARKLGTFDASTRPGLDCCTLFADRHPAIRTNLKAMEKAEEKLPLEELMSECLANVETRENP